MSDPTDPDRFEDPFAPEAEAEPAEADLEAPEADIAEQRVEMRRAADAPPTGDERDIEAPEADTVDQHRPVELDEDDYRD